MITLHFHLQPQYKYELFHINFTQLVYHRNIFGSLSKVFGNLRKSLDIFRNFRKFSENVRSFSSGLRNNFRKSSEIFGKWSEIVRKSSKTQSSECLYNKKIITRQLEDMNFMFSWQEQYSHSFTALTREILFLPLEHKIHIFLCNILYLYYGKKYSIGNQT